MMETVKATAGVVVAESGAGPDGSDGVGDATATVASNLEMQTGEVTVVVKVATTMTYIFGANNANK
jgi:hypothetical protein